MTGSEVLTAPHEARFLDMLDAGFRSHGMDLGLPPRLRKAVAATPRHRFVHRFRVADGPLRDCDTELAESLSVIYSDEVLRHVDAAGDPLASSNSQPSYILYLLHLLDLQPGQSVLEIGSGSGWLAAVMARLVGPAGRVLGVELIPDLAAQSRADLGALAVGNVRILTGDGTQGHEAAAPYDRAIITAATWDVPVALLRQVADDGLVLVPIERRGGDGCEVTLLRRRDDRLVGEQSVRGWFVPLLGDGQDRSGAVLRTMPEGEPAVRIAMPADRFGSGDPVSDLARFRTFLARTEPDFVTTAAGQERDLPTAPFGMTDRVSLSVALWQRNEILAWGDGTAASKLQQAYADWTALGRPGPDAFDLEVRAGGDAKRTDRQWVATRGSTALVWRLKY